ncbi:zinc ABC transporter substrate-binding protein ZnuA [Morganella morganii]|uniref:zinc ABC transporter substrate-binding protein ZnuA n=1 Tax=Morganella morganii TaxID=582 RepID=UPI001968151C|nr:zinc ABC transporter substrate-binding protein ZnuA [Morganella morganii]EKT0591604.1 zinc ABC transporter substrate-binding protein ZnuA [Morganella morganii]EKU0269481.1 zinc ABC transporter substrate-binding protein ZnuA [Morganella morganii]HEI8570082.1 zinc ABC transporter substrate-binding protein ZnuA [Morganella morganii]
MQHQSRHGIKTAFIATFLSLTAQTASADVLTSVRPVGLIAAAVADGVTDTQILLPDGASPHDYALKPSDLKKIRSADLVVWVGPELETFLQKPLSAVPEQKQIVISELESVKPFLLKNDEDDDHDEDGHHHHGEYNMHLWMSPDIARQTAQAVYNKLLVSYPDKKSVLDVNLRKFNGQLTETEKNIAQQLAPVKTHGYFVFHDAYGYFEKRFDLSPSGHFTVNPEIQPGAQTLNNIKLKLAEQNALCVFAEPQFRPAVIKAVAKGTNAKMGVLDPLGSGIAVDRDGYTNFLSRLSAQYASCLEK